MLMKKALLIALTLGLVVALATPALAVSWVAKGAIAIKGAYYKNIDLRAPISIQNTAIGGLWGQGIPGNWPNAVVPGLLGLSGGAGSLDPAWNRQSAWVQMRTVLVVTALASRNLYGTLIFEIDSQRWGTGEGSAIGAPDTGAWNADAVAVEVKGAFINFKVPQIPVTLRVGVQPFLKRSHIFMLLDAAGVDANIAFDISPLKIVINPFWARILEGLDHTQADDQDFYGVDVTVSGGGIAGGIIYAYQARRQFYDGVAPFFEGDSMMWWIGPHLDVNIGGFAGQADLIWSLGDEDDQSPANADISHSGWILRGELSYTMNKFRFGVGGLYGSGDDPTTLLDDEGYRVPVNSECAAHNDDFLVLMGDWGLNQPYGVNNVGGLFKPRSDVGAGVWYVRAFADYQLLSWLKVMGNVGYIGDTVDNGDRFNMAGVSGDLDDDDGIGWEFDVGVAINIYKELSLNSAFGYLIGGKALVGMVNGDRAQDPWMWATTLTYTF